MVRRGQHQHAHALVAARGVQVAQHLLEHRRVDRVANLGPIESQQRDALLVDVILRDGCHTSGLATKSQVMAVDLPPRLCPTRRLRRRSRGAVGR